MTGSGSPCGACKFLRRKCVKGCVFAPYFCHEQGATHFAAIHRVFGASNISKLLAHLPVSDRSEAAATIAYEAQARVQDPIYGCVSHIFALQQQVVSLQSQLASLREQTSQRQGNVPMCSDNSNHTNGRNTSSYQQAQNINNWFHQTENSCMNMPQFDPSSMNGVMNYENSLEKEEDGSFSSFEEVVDMASWLKYPDIDEQLFKRGVEVCDANRPKPHLTLPLPTGTQIPPTSEHQKEIEIEIGNSEVVKKRERKEKSNANAKKKKTDEATAEETRPKKKPTKRKRTHVVESDEEVENHDPVNTVVPSPQRRHLVNEGIDTEVEITGGENVNKPSDEVNDGGNPSRNMNEGHEGTVGGNGADENENINNEENLDDRGGMHDGSDGQKKNAEGAQSEVDKGKKKTYDIDGLFYDSDEDDEVNFVRMKKNPDGTYTECKEPDARPEAAGSSSGMYVPHWEINVNSRLDTLDEVRDALYKFPPPPVQQNLDELSYSESLTRAWSSTLHQSLYVTNLLRRAEMDHINLRDLGNLHFKCGPALKSIQEECALKEEKIKSLATEVSLVEVELGGVTLERDEWKNKLDDVSKENEELKETIRLQADKEKRLETKMAKVKADYEEKAKAWEAREAEVSLRLKEEMTRSKNMKSMLIHNVFPALTEKLLKSDEYKASIAEAFNMNSDAAWMKGVRVARKENEAACLIAKAVTKGLDVEAEVKALELFEGLSNIKYPFIQMVSESSHMNIGEVMALCPDSHSEAVPSLNPKFRPGSHPNRTFES